MSLAPATASRASSRSIAFVGSENTRDQPPEQKRQRVAPLGRCRAAQEHVGEPRLVHGKTPLRCEELLKRQMRETGTVVAGREKQTAARQESLARLERARFGPIGVVLELLIVLQPSLDFVEGGFGLRCGPAVGQARLRCACRTR